MKHRGVTISAAGMVCALLACIDGAVAAPLFEDSSLLPVTVAGPLEATLEDVHERRERRFTLTAGGAAYPVKIRVRGNSRVSVCPFPPLRVNFTRRTTRGTLFEGQDKLKLVTHCRGSRQAEQDLLEEYAAYRILNRLTDVSYRVRLLKLRYVDTAEGPQGEAVERYGFVVEGDDELAARISAAAVLRRTVTRGAFDQAHAGLVYLFQFLIGNTDWSLVAATGERHCCHNGTLFGKDQRLYYVPYDFDLSGLVNARYARPGPGLGISRVTNRRYRGYCTEPGALRPALDTVRSRREAVIGELRQLPDQNRRYLDRNIRYLEDFFEEAAQDEELLERFRKRCL